jgi:hypothetical protein
MRQRELPEGSDFKDRVIETPWLAAQDEYREKPRKKKGQYPVRNLFACLGKLKICLAFFLRGVRGNVQD